MSTTTDIDIIRTCIADGLHLETCDDDGYCMACGHQEGWDYDRKEWKPEYLPPAKVRVIHGEVYFHKSALEETICSVATGVAQETAELAARLYVTEHPPKVSDTTFEDAGGQQCTAEQAMRSWLDVADGYRAENGDTLDEHELWALRDLADNVRAWLATL